MTPIEILAYVGVALGVILAFVLPWAKKNADLVAAGKPTVAFAWSYIYAFIIDVVIVAFTIGALLLAFPLPDSGEGLLAAFWGALIYGLISASGVKLPFDWWESRKKKLLEIATVAQ